MTRLAAATPDWLDDAVTAWSWLGLLVIAALLVVAGLRARSGPSSGIAKVLMAPVAIALTVLVDTALKSAVREVRPCTTNLHVVTLERCPTAGDWSFPSNHTVVAVAAVAALWMIDRRLGVVGALAAAGVGVSRVWVGVHYPHDVLAAVVVGLAVAVPTMRQWPRLVPLVDRLRTRRLLPAERPASAH